MSTGSRRAELEAAGLTHPDPSSVSAELFVAASGGHDLSLRRFATPFTPYMPYRGLGEIGDLAVSPDGRYVAAIGDGRPASNGGAAAVCKYLCHDGAPARSRSAERAALRAGG